MTRKSSPSIFLILGLVFIAVGISTNQTAFSWIAIVFVILALIQRSRWRRPGK